MIILFGKKAETPKGRGVIPVDRVKELSGRGFSEPEIIDVLRKEGYSPEEIDKALTQALKSEVGEATPRLPTLEEIQPQETQPTPSQEPVVDTQPEPSAYPAYPTYPSYPVQPVQTGTVPEELVESVVKEKMSEIEEKLMRFRARYGELEQRLKEIHSRLDALVMEKSKGEEAILTRLDALKESFEELEGKISSLEKAFKEALPALIESVRSLSELVQRVRREA